MKTDRLVAYLLIAVWIGGLFSGADDLIRAGRWIAVVPLGLAAGAIGFIVWNIRRDRREGRLK